MPMAPAIQATISPVSSKGWLLRPKAALTAIGLWLLLSERLWWARLLWCQTLLQIASNVRKFEAQSLRCWIDFLSLHQTASHCSSQVTGQGHRALDTTIFCRSLYIRRTVSVALRLADSLSQPFEYFKRLCYREVQLWAIFFCASLISRSLSFCVFCGKFVPSYLICWYYRVSIVVSIKDALG